MRIVLACAWLMLAAPVAAAPVWEIQPKASRLGFVATQQGGEFEGHFGAFTANIRFAPDDLAASRFDVTIDVTSITTGSRLRDRELPKEEWFYFDDFPNAHYDAERFRAVGDGRYEAKGELTIRGNSQPVTLPFTWVIEGETAHMQGRVSIDRTHYGVGQGQWADGSQIGREVEVVVDLELHKAAE